MVNSDLSREMYLFLIKSAQDETNAEDTDTLMMICRAMALRQWGERPVRLKTSSIKDRFDYEDCGEREIKLLYFLLCTIYNQGELVLIRSFLLTSFILFY